MLSCPIVWRFMLFILISFRKDCGSFISVSFEFVRGELNDASSMFRVLFNGISLFWITTLSPCEKCQTYSLINFLKFLLRIPWPFLLGCHLSRKRSNLLFMFLWTINAKFSAVHFSCNSLLTFFPFSDSGSPRGIKDDIDTSVPLILYSSLNWWFHWLYLMDFGYFLNRLSQCAK